MCKLSWLDHVAATDGLYLFWFRKLARMRVNLEGKKQGEHKSRQNKLSFSVDESLGESQNII